MNCQIELSCLYIFHVNLRSIGAYSTSSPFAILGDLGEFAPFCNMIMFWLDQGHQGQLISKHNIFPTVYLMCTDNMWYKWCMSWID